MTTVRQCDLPNSALLCAYREQGAYADCYVTQVTLAVSHSEYIEAFYTSGLFKLERALLAWVVSRPSTDRQARELATGMQSSFAAWNVEARGPNQLLLSDFRGRTRSWLMSAPLEADTAAGTRLYFGSAVVPVVSALSGEPSMGVAFHALQGFHRLYSRALLRAAVSRLVHLGTGKR